MNFPKIFKIKSLCLRIILLLSIIIGLHILLAQFSHTNIENFEPTPKQILYKNNKKTMELQNKANRKAKALKNVMNARKNNI